MCDHLEQVDSNSELLGTLCNRRHDAVVVMHFHLSSARENTTPTRAITAILHANSCNKVYACRLGDLACTTKP